jgi:hypothetical protein
MAGIRYKKNKKSCNGSNWIAAILKKGGTLNQGDRPMEFVRTKTNRDHTLDGYKLVNGKLRRDNKSSVRGYLRPVDDISGMKQYGKNLYSKMKSGGTVNKQDKAMVDGIVNIIRKIRDKKNRRDITDDVIAQFKRENISTDIENFKKRVGYFKQGGALKCNTPKRTPDHKTKSHVVLACEGGKQKLIRFGQQGVKGSPKKEGESESYRKRREAFKARHAKNIAKGKMSAAFWSDRVKW